MKKAEVLNIFALVFNVDFSSHISQDTETQARDWGNKVFHTVGEVEFWNHLGNLNLHKPMRNDEMHPRVLRELVDVIAKPLSIIFQKSFQSGKDPIEWKKWNIMSIFKKDKKKDPGSYWPVSFTLCPVR